MDFFGDRSLAGLTIGVYQHSSVARDLVFKILAAFAATPIALGRADRFIPVDTEALRPEDETLAREWARERRYDAIISTDGDADRPLIADDVGVFLRGDLVGAMTSAFLGADAIVTPVTSNSALEARGCFKTVLAHACRIALCDRSDAARHCGRGQGCCRFRGERRRASWLRHCQGRA